MEFLELAGLYIVEYYWIPLFILYFGIIATILIENRNPAKTIAWILIIVFVPVAGILAYYFFGQKFKKVKRIQKINARQKKKLDEFLGNEKLRMNNQLPLLLDKIGPLSSVFKYLDHEKVSRFCMNNQVKLLINGEEKFPCMLRELRRASHSIHMEYYILEIDEIGIEILKIMDEKAQEGLNVRLILDSFGSRNAIHHIQRNNYHFEMQAFLPVRFSSLANSNYRNHRKIVVVDNVIGYIGGINISDRYINGKSSNTTYWRDTSIEIRGCAVNYLQIQFWNSWSQTEGKQFVLSSDYYNDCDTMETNGATIAFAASDPGSKGPYTMESIISAIGDAQEGVQLVSPYFIPTDELLTAINIASGIGLKVQLLLPKKSDSFLVQHASMSYLKPLLQRNVEVYLYTKGFVHSKTICIDKKMAFVGTTNLDIRSFYINYEISAVIADSQFCQQLSDQFEKDLQDAELLTYKKFMQRSRWERGIDSLCRLLAPLL